MPSMPGAVRQVRDIGLFIASAAVVLAAVACGSSSSNPSSPKTGALAVIVTAPNGTSPTVTVSGPNGYSTSVSTSTTLTGLAVGSYTVTAKSVVSSDRIVGTVDTAAVSGSPASVTAGTQDTVTAAYALRPGTGGLWVANSFSTTIIEYTASQLTATTSSAPMTAIGTPDTPWGVAFDGKGNLWETTLDKTIIEFAASDLGASGKPTPKVTIAEATLSEPAGIAFDANGNLWVANLNVPSIVEFSASQLGSSGAPTPAVTITASVMMDPAGLAFDGNGNLWFSNDLGNTIVEFTANQLTSGGVQTPAVILSSVSNSIAGPVLIALTRPTISGSQTMATTRLSPSRRVSLRRRAPRRRL